LKNRESELLPVPYYHIVFTLPHHLNELLPKQDKLIYNCLLKAAWKTIKVFGEDPRYLGAKMGMVCILHTWGQQLWLHPHVHCIVPAGGITKSGKWKQTKYAQKYLFPKRALSKVFRAGFMALLRREMEVPQPLAKKLFVKPWVVYAKRPFATPKTVIEYLGRYTHKVAISNHRITEVDNKNVSFFYKNYRDAAKKKIATISGEEFLRRFAMHILPHGFMRIRHYGILASRNKATELNLAKTHFSQPRWKKQKHSWEQIARERLNFNPLCCPNCKQESLITIQVIDPKRGPPIQQTGG